MCKESVENLHSVDCDKPEATDLELLFFDVSYADSIIFHHSPTLSYSFSTLYPLCLTETADQ